MVNLNSVDDFVPWIPKLNFVLFEKIRAQSRVLNNISCKLQNIFLNIIWSYYKFDFLQITVFNNYAVDYFLK